MAAVLLVGLFGVLALAIDSSRLSTTSREKTETANAMALAAISAYVSVVDSSGAPVAFERPISDQEQETRFRAAVERALRIAEANRLSARFNEAQSVAGVSDLVGGFNGGLADQDGLRGRIETGRWYSNRPSVCTRQLTCPCNLAGHVESRGCFMKCSNDKGCRSPDLEDEELYPANAVRVTLWTKQGEGIAVRFSGALGIPETPVRGEGTAAIAPRRVVLLSSLARSETFESHLAAERRSSSSSPTPPPAAEYAFVCKGGCSPRDIGSATPASCDRRGFDAVARNSSETSPDYDPRVVWSALPDSFGSGTPFARGKMDYECVQFRTGDSGEELKSALVDYGTPAPAINTEPQPFTNILKVTNSVLTSLQSSMQSGDRVALIGYGGEIQGKDWQPSATNLDFDSGRRWSFAAPQQRDPWYQSMLQLTESTAQGREKRIRNGFFPLGNDPYSDLPKAIDTAREMLLNDGFAGITRNAVVVISSGLTNCWREDGERDPKCAGSYNANVRSLEEVVLRATSSATSPSLVSSGVTFFPVLVGANVRPHRLIYKSNLQPTRCMTPFEMIEAQCHSTSPLVSRLGEVDKGNSAAAFRLIGAGVRSVDYLMPGYYLAMAASATGGTLLPILDSPTCPSGVNSLCQPSGTPRKTNFEELMDKACEKQSSSPTGMQACSSEPNRSWQWRVLDESLQPNLQDEYGRIFCDPKCRDVKAQASNLLTEFLEAPSILLVEDSRRI